MQRVDTLCNTNSCGYALVYFLREFVNSDEDKCQPRSVYLPSTWDENMYQEKKN